MYTKDEFTEFGYVKPTSTKNLNFRYSFDENIFYGRYCKSAIATIDASTNSMKCIQISDVTSNLDEHKAPQKMPAKCLY